MGGVPAKWRVQSMMRGDRRYWFLETGRGSERRKASLGYVTEEQAAIALASMQAEEDETFGTTKYGRWAKLRETDAAKALAVLLGDVEGEDVFGPEPTNYPAVRLRDYYEDVYRKWREKDRPRTWRTEVGHWKRILADLGDERLGDIDDRMVVRWLRDLTARGPGGRGEDHDASGAYKRLIRAALQSCLNYAYIEGHLDEREVLGALPIKGSTKRAVEQVEPLSLDEVSALMAASEPKYRAMWAVGAGQGLRPSELAGLRWERVNFDGRLLGVAGTKTEQAAAVVPMTPLAYRELREWWVRQGQPKEGVVFPANAAGGEYRAVSGYKKALAGAAEAAGIARTVSPYLLRHSFATIAWSLGIEMDVARRILRHADETMLREVDCRPRPAELVAKVAAFDVPNS